MGSRMRRYFRYQILERARLQMLVDELDEYHSLLCLVLPRLWDASLAILAAYLSKIQSEC